MNTIQTINDYRREKLKQMQNKTAGKSNYAELAK